MLTHKILYTMVAWCCFAAWSYLLTAPRAVPHEVAPAIPDLSGKALTVNGPMDPSSIGVTLMHEHLLIDLNLPDYDVQRWRTAHQRPPPTRASEVGIYRSPLTIEILAFVELGYPNHDNFLLDDEQLAVREVNEFRRRGGNTVVDVTSIGLKRDPLALRRVADATNLNIVMGSSWYHRAWHPRDVSERSLASLTDQIVREVTTGVDGTGIRAGIIGEVGTHGDPLTPDEIKVIRASGRASRMTGAPISLHTAADLREQPKILDLLASERTDLKRVIVGHSDSLVVDRPFLRCLLKRGVYIEIDDLGGAPPRPSSSISDGDLARAVVDLIREGYLRQILLSQDVCTKVQLKAYGGTGYAFILETFIPYLKELGVSDDEIRVLMVENPRNALTFSTPAP